MAYRTPPPAQLFATWELARDAVQLWAKDEGIAVVMGRTKPDKRGTTRKVWLPCSRHGEFKPEGTGKRETSTAKTDCLWHITITRLPDRLSWKIDGEADFTGCLVL